MVAVAVALGGVLLGVLWWWLAPHVPLVGDVVEGNWVVFLKDTEGEQAVGVDGTFTLLGLAFGVVSALVVFLLRRRGGVPLVVGLAVGGLLGSFVAWRVGVWLGPAEDVVAHAREVGRGVTFSAPLRLGAKGALLAWPFAALVLHLGLTALFGPRDPEPEFGHGPYEAPPAGLSARRWCWGGVGPQPGGAGCRSLWDGCRP
ncbi:ABC transporter permease OS=Streptomyces violarus OX=67380 GN=FHS41_005858 PE=4 SV=1 [Streptomyces violarus]